MILLSFILFCIIFVGIFYSGKSSAINNYNEANSKVPSIRSFGADPMIKDLFVKYGALFGIGLGLIMLISSYLLYGISALFKLTKYKITMPIILLLVYGFWFLIALKLAFFEKGYTAWANGIIYFSGGQLFYSTLIIVIIAVMLFFLPDKKRGGKNE
jgi:hypothetical protein